MKHISKKLTLVVTLLFVLCGTSLAQQRRDWAVKTNLIYDATLTINAGLEHQFAPHWSVDLSGNINAWSVGGHKWRHWMIQPEARYWFCEAIGGHFVALHALGGEYNVANVNLGFKMLGTDFRNLRDHRYQGWYTGLGVAYGYSWMLNRHWNIEAELGLGWIYTRYDVYPCAQCGKRIAHDRSHNYFGPTKAAVNLVYVF